MKRVLMAVLVLGLVPVAGCGFWPEPRCVVGVYGTDVTIEVTGPQPACDRIVDSMNRGIEQGAEGRQGLMKAYKDATIDPNSTIMCRFTYRGSTHFTVRDKGLLRLFGTMTCVGLADQADFVEDT